MLCGNTQGIFFYSQMKRLIFSLFCTLAATQALAGSKTETPSKYQSPETYEYIEKYYKTAIRHMLDYKIPASITLAQGILESGSGRSELAVKANNHFGIKCKTGYKGKEFHLDDETPNECFRVYDNAEESYKDHALFLTERPYYKPLFKLKTTDYKGWAKGLKECGYATNPKYAQRLIDIIEDNKLYKFDNEPATYLRANGLDPVKIFPKNEAPVMQSARGEINGVKCVMVTKGSTLYSIAQNNGITVSQLKRFNELPRRYVPHDGDVIFVEPKKAFYTEAKFHYAEPKENIWTVSQRYGITMQALRAMNGTNKWRLKPGQRLTLH